MAFIGLSWKHVVDTFMDVDKAIDSVVHMISGESKNEKNSGSDSDGSAIIAAASPNKVLVLKRKKEKSDNDEDEGSSCSKRSSIDGSSSESDDQGAIKFLSSLTNVIIKPAMFIKKSHPYSGIDSWVPADNEEIAEIPKDLINSYSKVHPNVEGPKKFKLVNGEFSVLTNDENLWKAPQEDMEEEKNEEIESREEKLTRNQLNDSQKKDTVDKKKEKSEEKKPPIHHLAITLYNEDSEKYVMSLYRSHRVSDVVALCERCRENPELFRVFPTDVNIKDYLHLIFNELRENMTWKSVHIASKIGLVEFFKNHKTQKLQKLFNMIAQPEGLSPLMIAIQSDQIETTKLMLEKGADLNFITHDGSNALHIAATSSTDMIKFLWETKKCATMLNKSDTSGNSPMYIALTNGCLSNARLLSSFGASITATDAVHETTLLIGAMKRGKLDEAIMKKILEIKPDALSEKETQTGNSPIHCAINKRSIIFLLEKYKDQTNPCVVNSLQQTPLHVFVNKEDMGLIMSICAYGVDIDAGDCNGNTALHYAVMKGNLEITRQLLSLGANPNTTNHCRESPRHIAARLADKQKGMDLVRSLIICGADTCSNGFVGCAFGCMHRDLLGACKELIGGKEKEGRLEEKVQQVHVSSDASSAPYEFVLDPDTHVVDEAYAEKNEIRGFPHEMALQRVKRRLEEIVEQRKLGKKSNLINALALDGGGIRGLVTIQMLLSLEKYLDKPAVEYFDWIAATSTGTFIMSAMIIGQTLRQAQKYYIQFKDQLFDAWTRPYDTVILEKLMRKCFGEDRLMSEILYPKIFATAVRADTFPVQLDLCRNYRLPVSDKENEELGFFDPKKLHLWRACRRSSAAPTYFSASEGKYIDGGMISNNPTLDLLSEICFWNTTCQKAGVAEKMVDVGCVLSVGTGVTPISPVDPSVFEMNDFMGLLRGIKNLSLVVIDQATATEGAPITRSRSWCHSLGIPYFRLNAPLFKDIILDTSDDADLSKIMWDSVVYAHTHRKDFEEVAELLKLVGTNEERKAAAAAQL